MADSPPLADPDRFRWRVGGLPPPASHWTSKGVFAIDGDYRGGSRWAVVSLDGRELGLSNSFAEAAIELASGRFDSEIGYAAKHLIPADVNGWNMLR